MSRAAMSALEDGPRAGGQTGASRAPPIVVAHSAPEWLPLTQTWLHEQVRRLPPELVESLVVCERLVDAGRFPVPRLFALSERVLPVRLWDLGLRALRLRRHLGLLVREGRRAGVRIVHSHFGNIGWADVRAARALGASHVVTFYGLDVRMLPQRDPRWLGRYREMFAAVSAVLCEGSHMARAIEALGCPRAKIRVHHLGVPVDDIAYAPRVLRPGEPLRVLIAASFREKKGVPIALEAVARARRTTPIEVTVIGDAGREPAHAAEKARILETIARHGLGGSVRLLGYQPHDVLFEEAYRHHVFLSPSVTAADGDTEGGAPVAIVEMAATGMPIVSSRHCDIPEVVRDGETGLLADERDAGQLAAHLVRLAADPAAWRPMLDAGRRHIEREYDARRQGERLAAVYASLVRAPAV